VFDTAFRTVFGAEAEEVSLAWYLFYTGAGGGFFRLVDVEGGAQETRFREGAHALAARLADSLGERVVLNSPVEKIRQTQDGVEIAGAGSRTVSRRAVVAVPLTLIPKIEFDPPLPAARIELARGMRMGATAKVLVLYPRRFWRDRGLSGQTVASGRGPLTVAFDNSSEDGRQAALVGFIVGNEARAWTRKSCEERRRVLLDQLSGWFGPEAREPTEIIDHDWSQEPWVQGCPVASPPPGLSIARAECLREPAGRIHWAGTETATKNPGYLDGAVRSGERAAAEALRGLGSR
jgi:monoamine oxidase